MSERIVVCCNNKEAHDEVQKKAFTEGYGWGYGGKKTLSNHWQEIIPKIYLFLYSKDNDMTFSHSKPSDDAIISASEYLNEFKVGDRVECINAGYCGRSTPKEWLTKGSIYTIKEICSSKSLRLYETKDGLCPQAERFKLATKQTKEEGTSQCTDIINQALHNSTKENTMNINDNVLEVFKEDAVLAGKISNRFGTQYGTTDRDTLALRRDKTSLVKIIKAEEDAAEKSCRS